MIVKSMVAVVVIKITCDKIDNFICAEIPDASVDYELYQTITYVQHGAWTL